jgi:hypothetical protein
MTSRRWLCVALVFAIALPCSGSSSARAGALPFERAREPPPVMANDPPAAAPPGPRARTRPNLGLLLGGASLLVATWVTMLAIGLDLDGHYRIYGVPFAGAFIAQGEAFGRLGKALYATDGAGQLAGAGLMIAGLLARRPIPNKPCLHVSLAPLGRGRALLALDGRF